MSRSARITYVVALALASVLGVPMTGCASRAQTPATGAPQGASQEPAGANGNRKAVDAIPAASAADKAVDANNKATSDTEDQVDELTDGQ